MYDISYYITIFIAYVAFYVYSYFCVFYMNYKPAWSENIAAIVRAGIYISRSFSVHILYFFYWLFTSLTDLTCYDVWNYHLSSKLYRNWSSFAYQVKLTAPDESYINEISVYALLVADNILVDKRKIHWLYFEKSLIFYFSYYYCLLKLNILIYCLIYGLSRYIIHRF